MPRCLISILNRTLLPDKNRNIFVRHRSEVKVLQRNPSAGRERYIGEGGFDCGSNQLSASPVAPSLHTFLCEDKKVWCANIKDRN